MINVMFNFTNVTDEIMTQRELEKSPDGLDFIGKWTWPNQECVNKCPRFRCSNTVEDYFYVRLVEADMLLAMGAVRIHWKDGFKMILDTSLQIVMCGAKFQFENPYDRYDLEGIIREKLYQYLAEKMIHGRYHCEHPAQPCPRPCPPPPRPCPPHPPRPPMPPHPPCNHGNPPKNGPYGGTYNAYDELRHHCHPHW